MCWLAGCAVIAYSTTATAQPPANETDREQARRLVKLGDERYATGDFAAAHQAYQGAHLIMGVPTTGLQVARAEVALGKLLEARRTLQGVVGFPVQEGEPEAFTSARAAAAELVDEVVSRMPTLVIRIIGAPPGQDAWVSIDGDLVEHTVASTPQALNPGPHVVAAGLPGHPTKTREITLEETDAKVLQIDVTPTPSPKPPAPIVVPTTELSPLVWIGFGVAGAGTIVGAVTGGISLALASEVRGVCFEGRICPRSAEDKRDRSLALAHASTVSFALAGLGSLVGIIGFVISRPADPNASVTVRAAVTPGGLTVSGAF